MNRIIYLFSSMLIFTGLSDTGTARKAGFHGQLSVSGTNIKGQDGETVLLQGVSYSWHNWWPRFYNPGSVKWLAEDWNCNIVRAAMGVEPQMGYLQKPHWSKKKIEAVVEEAIETDIYVIIDWHSHSIQTRAAVEFFGYMAEKYGRHPNLLYEIYNEPVYDSWEEVKAYSLEVIRAIRAHDPDNIILVGSPHWCQDLHLVARDPIRGFENLMYTLHFYAGGHGMDLLSRADSALQAGIPVFVSESGGMDPDGNGALDMKSWKKWIEWIDANRLGWITWSISDEDETCSMLEKSASSEGEWKETDLKESGRITRELIRKRTEP